MAAMKIDAHHHFWDPARGDYGWMPADDPVLSRVYGPQDMAAHLAEGDVAQTVLVQAAPSLAETEYLLSIADKTPHVAGVVGWVDFEDPAQITTVKRLAAHPKFTGLRPMIQDIAQDDWMLRADLDWAFRAMIDHDLTFDLLGFPRHVAPALELLGRYPDLRVVLDHGMKPDIASRSFQGWADGMARLAGETQAFCKLSGLVTEAEQGATGETLKPYVDHLIGMFGPDRLMWGSDWPVSRLRMEYGDWLAMAEGLTAHLPTPARRAIFHGTATRFYRL